MPTVLSCGQHCSALSTGFYFQDSDFAGDLQNSTSASGRVLCIFGSRTLVPISWMCKKQTSVSHSSTESEIISLDAGLRMDGLPAFELLGHCVCSVTFHNQHCKRKQTSPRRLVRDWSTIPSTKTESKHQLKQESERLSNCYMWISFPPTHILLRMSFSCTFSEDKEAVIKMIIKGRS